jgi:hypothetical protein
MRNILLQRCSASLLRRNALEAAAAVHMRDVALLRDLQPKPVSVCVRWLSLIR